MIEPMTYEELMEYVPKDFHKFVSDGLSPNQAISRLIDEYELQTDDYEEINWMFNVLLAEIGVRHNCLREEIREEALKIICDKRLITLWKQKRLSDSEISCRTVYLENVKDAVQKLVGLSSILCKPFWN
ncbi:Imm3 family immunity protein [Brevibacillus gelatini]